MIAGVDGCKDGWIAVIESDDCTTRVQRFQKFGQILDCEGLALVVVDIPIGLRDKGPRPADKEARRLLGKRGCCVFPAPIRPILACHTHERASEVWMSIEQKKCNRQTWGILNKVVEVDDVMKAGPDLQKRIREGHPEVTFAVMRGGKPIPSGKSAPAGQSTRLALLRPHFPDIGEWLSNHLKYLGADIIDASAMLWTARRVKSEGAIALPPNPDPDTYGLKPQIFA